MFIVCKLNGLNAFRVNCFRLSLDTDYFNFVISSVI